MQVFATYPGVGSIITATMPRTLGVLPNAATVQILPQASLPFANGNLVLGHGSDIVIFPSCRVDSTSIQLTRRGHVQALRILDRRWKWAFGAVDGIYNVKQTDGTIQSSSLRSARQLADLLFTALGETQWDSSVLPGNDYPAVEWDCHPARVALAQLCGRYGCDVDLDVLTNIPRVVLLGFGDDLPANYDVVNVSIGVDFSELPDVIEVCGDFVLVQSKLKLQAVGIDIDGSIVAIDELSYTPDNGWESQKPDDLLPDADEATRFLANSSVFRMFRVTSQANGSQSVPNYSGTISDIQQLFPLKRRIVEAYTTEIGADPQDAYVSGVFQVGGNPPPLENTDINTRLSNDFRLIADQGILIFNDPITKLNDDLQPTAPELYFITSYYVKDATRGQFVRYTRSRAIASNGTPTHSVPRPDLKQTIVAQYADDGVTVASVEDNKTTVDQQAEISLDSLQSQYFASGASNVIYRSIQPIRLSGTVREVTWSVSRHRKQPAPAMTIAAYNSEISPAALRAKERARLLAGEGTIRAIEQEQDRLRKLRREGGLA